MSNPHAHGFCEKFGKASYRSPQAADKRRRALKVRRGDPLHVFRCKHCKLWHLGHDDKQTARFHGK